MPLVRKPDKEKPQPGLPSDDALSALTNGNPEERWNAARAAAQLAGGVAALAAALQSETDLRVREAMFTSLTRVGSPQSVSAIIPLLRADDANLRTGALDALRAMPAAVRASLPELLADRDSDVRVLSCEIARSLPGEEATTILCNLLAHEAEANVCAAAIDVLAEVGGPMALPVLARCAERFSEIPFLAFAIKIARDRILSQSTDANG
jgi:HEAT repeat protein